MATRTKYALKGKDRDSYLELVLVFPLASIKSDEHLAEAQKVMDRLLAKGELDDGEEMYLNALSDLVAAYEDAHHAIEPAADADMLRHLMEAKGRHTSATQQRDGNGEVFDLRSAGGEKAVQSADDSQAGRLLQGGRERAGGECVTSAMGKTDSRLFCCPSGCFNNSNSPTHRRVAVASVACISPSC